MRQALVICLGCLFLTTVFAVHHDAIPDSLSDDEEGEFNRMEGRSMESLLHWGIANSDPKALKQHAHDMIKEEAISAMKERKERVRQLLDYMNQQPSEAQLIQEAITILTHPESNAGQQLNALAALQILVEPIDNANDLHGMGGLGPLMAAMASSNSSLQAAAAYVVGTAASNNPKFQESLHTTQPEVFKILVELISVGDEEVVVKGLYAAAAMVRNLVELRQAFFDAGGLDAVHAVLTTGMQGGQQGRVFDLRSQRKAVSLLVDLVHLDKNIATLCIQKGIPDVLSQLLRQPDSDIQEKALDAIKTLIRYSKQAVKAFNDAGAGVEIEKLHALLLSQLMASHGDLDDHYEKYLIALVREVQIALSKPADPEPRSEL